MRWVFDRDWEDLTVRVLPKSTICSLPASDVKTLLRYERFDTLDAMRVLSLEEPAASRALAALAGDGWISFRKTDGFIDRWERAEKGQRLVATRIMKPIAREQGLQILNQVVERARAANACSENSARVERIILFGSLLEESAAEVGDVDIVVDFARRKLPPRMLDRIFDAEVSAAGEQAFRHYLDRLSWPETKLLRQLRASPRVSFHYMSDIEAIKAECRSVYEYDVDTEKERQPRPVELRSSETQESQTNEHEEPQYPNSRATTNPVDWPRPRNRRAAFRIDVDQERRVQHMWANGAPIEAIAEKTNLSREDALTYLGWQSNGPLDLSATKLNVNLAAMLPRPLPDYVKWLLVEVKIRNGEIAIVTEVAGARGVAARIWNPGTHKHIDTGRDDFRRTAEKAHAAAAEWARYVRPKVVGIELETVAFCTPDQKPITPAPESAKFPDMRELGRPMHAAYQKVAFRTGSYRIQCAAKDGKVRTSFARSIAYDEWKECGIHPESAQAVDRTAQRVLGQAASWLIGVSEFRLAVSDWTVVRGQTIRELDLGSTADGEKVSEVQA